jgi:ATP-binding cassette subfamily D (ALD) long-chain fatty acid import protein
MHKRPCRPSQVIFALPPEVRLKVTYPDPRLGVLDSRSSPHTRHPIDSAMRTLSSKGIMSASNQALARARLKQVLDAYLHHRPTVQRLLTAGFVIYCLGTTYQNLSGNGAKGGARMKASRRGKASGTLLLLSRLMVDGKKKVSVSDPLFYVRLKKLIRIVIPSIRSREAAMLALHSAFLLLRTGISLYVADLDGR